MIALTPMAIFIGALSLQIGILMQLPHMPPLEKLMQFVAYGLIQSMTLFMINLDFVALVIVPAAIVGLLIAAVGRMTAQFASMIAGYKQRQTTTQSRGPSLPLTQATQIGSCRSAKIANRGGCAYGRKCWSNNAVGL